MTRYEEIIFLNYRKRGLHRKIISYQKACCTYKCMIRYKYISQKIYTFLTMTIVNKILKFTYFQIYTI